MNMKKDKMPMPRKRKAPVKMGSDYTAPPKRMKDLSEEERSNTRDVTDMIKKGGSKKPMEENKMKKGGMACGGKTKKKYQAGGMAMADPMARAMDEEAKKERMARMARGQKAAGSAAGMTSGMKTGGKVTTAKKEAKKAVKKHEEKMHKGGNKMASGGKVRGCGIAKKGVRKAKMM